MANDLTKIKTNALADDAVTLAKQAAGTDGQIITYDASGNPTAVGPGTDGQVLTSTGAGSPPAFEALPASGPTLSGSTDNTVVTVTGANALAGEANLTFDGDALAVSAKLQVTHDDWDTARVENTNADANGAYLDLVKNSSSPADGDQAGVIRFRGDDDAGNEHSFANILVTCPDVSNGAEDGQIEFQTSSGGTVAERLRITQSGNLKILDGDLQINTAGHGIDFSAQTATSASGSSTTSELLDHYEEGTWTPDLRGYNHSAGAWGSWPKDAAGSASGKYIRVGSVCHVWFQWTGLDVQSGSQYPSIMGLPFSGSGTRGHGSAGYEDFFTNSTTVTFKVSGTYMEPISDTNSNPVMNETANRSMYAGMTYLVA